MRRRLVVVFVTLTVLVVALYGIPRAVIRADQVRDRELEQVSQSALLIASLIGALESSDQVVTEEVLAAGIRPGERVEYLSAEGTVVSAGEPPGIAGVESTVAVPTGGSLTLEYSRDAVNERVRDAVLPLLLIGLFVVVLAGFAALLLARRLTRPFLELADFAKSLGSGRFDLDVPRYDVPEADAVGQALVTSARNLDLLVTRERDFAVNASHELRTPLTAARLRLEDLALWPETPREVTAELAETLVELNRLDTAVTALLDRDRVERHAAAVDVDLSALINAAAERWRPLVVAQARRITLDVEGAFSARLVPGSADEMFDGLLEHLVTNGAGTVTLSIRRTPDYVEVRAGDESVRTQGTELLHLENAQSPTTLSKAAEWAASVGGHLTIGAGPTTCFLLKLPSSRHHGTASEQTQGE